MTSIHQQLFLRNCYTCNNFGHMARNCKLMVPIEKGITPQTSFYNKSGTRINPQGRSYNYFAPLQSYNIECYKCGNLGHIAKNCKLVIPMDNTSKSQDKEERKAWKKKDNMECSLALSATNKKNLWHVDSGCSKHMTGDPNKFISLKRN